MGNGKEILVVEDEALSALFLKRRLERMGYTVTGTPTQGEEAVALARESAPDLLLVDINLAGTMDGIETVRAIKTFADVPVVFLTGYSDPFIQERAEGLKPAAIILKPVDAAKLGDAVRSALEA